MVLFAQGLCPFRLIYHVLIYSSLPVCMALIIFIFLLLNDTLHITAMKQSGVEALKIVKTTQNTLYQQWHCPGRYQLHEKVLFRSSAIALLPFDCLATKESQDFLMPRMGSSQQIDVHQGTVHSFKVSWPESRKISLV